MIKKKDYICLSEWICYHSMNPNNSDFVQNKELKSKMESNLNTYERESQNFIQQTRSDLQQSNDFDRRVQKATTEIFENYQRNLANERNSSNGGDKYPRNNDNQNRYR